MVMVFSGQRIVSQQETSPHSPIHDMDDGNFIGSKDFDVRQTGHEYLPHHQPAPKKVKEPYFTRKILPDRQMLSTICCVPKYPSRPGGPTEYQPVV